MVLAVGIGEGYFYRSLCFGEGCWEEFSRLFSMPISVAVLAGKALVAYSAVAGILVAVNNYVETRRVASAQVHLASRSSFERFVLDELSKMTYLSAANVSIHAWYAAIYPDSARGDLGVAAGYLKILDDVRLFAAKTDSFIVKAGRGYRHDRYHGPVIEMLGKFGFDLAGSSRLEFFSLEREAFSLINATNSVFCSEASFANLQPSRAHGIP